MEQSGILVFFPNIDEGSEIIRYDNFWFADLINPGNTSKFSDGSFTSIGRDSNQVKLIFAICKFKSILVAFDDLDNHIEIFGCNSSWKNA